MTDSIALVQARISEIQSRFGGSLRAAPSGALGSEGSTFADALAEATGGTGGGSLLSPNSALAGLPGSVAETAVVAGARRYLGVPYRWGGTDPTQGLDCSGLVRQVYGDLGLQLPRTSAEQARVGRPVASLAEARPGDLLFFDDSGRRAGIDHVAIYTGNGRMIEAPRTGLDVREVEVPTASSGPVAIRRVLDAGGAGDAVGSAGSGSLARLFSAAGARHGVDPALLSAVARAESGYQPDAVSPAGARGLMQLMPQTAQGLGVDPFDPAQAVDGAARLLSGYLRQFGSVPLALAAYNAGPNAVRRYGGVPPYEETQNYIRRVQNYLEVSR